MKEPSKHLGAAPHAPKVKRVVSLPAAVIVTVIVAACAFVLGTRSSSLAATLLSNEQNKNLPADLDWKQLSSVYNLLRSRYDGKIEASKLLDGAKKGLVEATGDPYTSYFTDEEAKEFFGELDGKFSGIGAELGKKNNQLTIISTIENSPAQKAGLLKSDVIGRVNGDDTVSWTVEKAVSQIRGEKGTSVKLTIVRGGEEVKEITVVRDDIVDPSARSEMLDGNIGYIKLSRFNESDTVSLARRAAENFKAKNVRGVVLDLRGNGGGYVESARGVAGIWLNEKVVVEERQGSKVVGKLTSVGEPILEGVRTVVLVDGGSASASEIVAGALRDYGAATLIGEKTFGKGSVQSIEEVPGGGQLKVTIAKWFTPKGVNINKQGIEPDETVEANNAADILAGKDAQKEWAIGILKR